MDIWRLREAGQALHPPLAVAHLDEGLLLTQPLWGSAQNQVPPR